MYQKILRKFPEADVKLVKSSKITNIKVKMKHSVQGSTDEVENWIDRLLQEWSYMELERAEPVKDGYIVSVLYKLKPEEITDFLRRVPYRGNEICLRNMYEVMQ